MNQEELQKTVDNIDSQSVQVSNCSFEMLRWIEDGPRSVKELLRDYDLLKASFEANADETITLRKRFEDLWQVKQNLETDIARLKKQLSEARDEFDDLAELCETNGLPVTRIKCGKPKLSPKVRLERYGATFCKKCGAPCINQRQGCNCEA